MHTWSVVLLAAALLLFLVLSALVALTFFRLTFVRFGNTQSTWLKLDYQQRDILVKLLLADMGLLAVCILAMNYFEAHKTRAALQSGQSTINTLKTRLDLYLGHLIQIWVNTSDGANRAKLAAWMADNNLKDVSLMKLCYAADYQSVRERLVQELPIRPQVIMSASGAVGEKAGNTLVMEGYRVEKQTFSNDNTMTKGYNTATEFQTDK